MTTTMEVEYDASTVIEALLFLVSRYQKSPDATLRQAIVEHMGMLSRDPEVDSDSLRITAKRLQRFWACECDLKKREQIQSIAKPAGVSLH